VKVSAVETTATQLWIGRLQGGHYRPGRWIPTSPGQGPRTFTTSVWAAFENPELVIWADPGALDARISKISIAREDAVMDMDTMDKRAYWRNNTIGRRAQIVPRGNAPAGTPNWAVRVQSTSITASHRELALLEGRTYQICFDAKVDVPPTPNLQSHVVVEVSSGGTQAMSAVFLANTTWQRFCAPSFVPSSSENDLRMRGIPFTPAAYLVDNIAITSL
jgi:hypothetical protein